VAATGAHILVVEDENIVAKDIEHRLKALGYNVSALASSGEEALQKARDACPDLVLMDIRLKGAMDGVDTAEELRRQFNVPVVYLTAYADANTLQRAKVTQPFGYILKPFEERELYTCIEVALYKHQMERRLKESEQWWSRRRRWRGVPKGHGLSPDGILGSSVSQHVDRTTQWHH